ncbi:MAG: putative membrane protein [Solidesulfovibrio magneticus str. Maddingley MBC34]|uniref:Putative membrane protein n=1 Tax=Solidesulfovibrio magneticus str. Maddingley MBC34 TaxID=1206767 RepID=K6HCH7_9BACT|nr:MAG: putative membrane protein [Solidesulfovibrio magneticus str. Maddingley MBC34]
MSKLVSAFFSPADREAIVAAVAVAEARTSAELVPMVVEASDDYPKAGLACAVVVGLCAGLMLCLAFGTRNFWLFLLFGGLFALAGFEAARRCPDVKRLFVSKARRLAETRQAAQAAFFTHGLTETKHRNAVLVYISIFERLVFIQPDKGLAGRLDAAALDAATAAFSRGIAAGRQKEALIACLDTLADLLAPLFPPDEADTNEIKNLILI